MLKAKPAGNDSIDGGRRWLLSTGGAVAVSILILLAISLAQKTEIREPPVRSEDLRSVVLDDPPPPPPIAALVSTPPAMTYRISESPSSSPIRIAATPPAVFLAARPVAVPDFSFTLDPFKPRSEDAEFGADRIYRGSDVDQVPIVVYQEAPTLPPGILHGVDDPRVTLLFVVSDTGRAEQVKVLRSADERLDRAIIDAVLRWRFRPAVRSGRRVACWVQQPFYVSRLVRENQSFGDFR
jgi:protein TonB